ncbi:hypothetical protein Agub_g4051, partial [Astrephomene gubernaculifera]
MPSRLTCRYSSSCKHLGRCPRKSRHGTLNHRCSPSAALPPSPTPTESQPLASGVTRNLPQPASPATATAAATNGTPPTSGGAQQASQPAATPSPTGYIALSLVPVLWGTYNPCIRYLYAEPDPLDPASLTAVRTALSAGALLLPALLGYVYRKVKEAWLHNNSGSEAIIDSSSSSSSTSSGAGSNDSSGQHMRSDATAAFTQTASATGSLELQQKQQQQLPPHQHQPSRHHQERLGLTLAAAADGAADGVAAAAAAAAAEEDDEDGYPGCVQNNGSGGDSRHALLLLQNETAAATAPHALLQYGSSATTTTTSNTPSSSGDSVIASSSNSGGGLFSEPLSGVRLGPLLTRTFRSVVLGGLELGVLNFVGTALQVEGLHSTSATRAGFLAEVTAVLTPLVSYAAGYDIPRQMWLAVAVGLVGSTMVAYDTSQAHETRTAESADATTSTAGTPQAGPLNAAAPSSPASPALAASTAAATEAAATTAVAIPSALAPPGDDAYAALAATIATTVVPEATSDTVAEPAAALLRSSLPQLQDSSLSLGSIDLTQAATQMSGDIATTAGAAAAAANASTTDGLFSAAVQSGTVDAALSAAHTMASAALESTVASVAASNAALEAAGGIAGDAVAAAAAATVTATAAGAAAAAVAAVAATATTVSAASSAATEATTAAAAAAAAAAAVAAPSAGAASQLAITGGEAYLLLACLFYSLCTVRMGQYAPRHDTVALAAMKKVGLSSCSLMWMAANNLQSGAALDSVFSFPDLSSRTPLSIAVLLYSGLGPGASATLLQVTGLSTVPATTAQVIYSMTPLLTAFFAFLILGGEATGPVAWAGGCLIIAAALVAADAQHKQ